MDTSGQKEQVARVGVGGENRGVRRGLEIALKIIKSGQLNK